MSVINVPGIVLPVRVKRHVTGVRKKRTVPLCYEACHFFHNGVKIVDGSKEEEKQEESVCRLGKRHLTQNTILILWGF